MMYTMVPKSFHKELRGIRIEQDTSTCFDDKRQPATQKKRHASQQGMVGRAVGWGKTEIVRTSLMFMLFIQKGA